MRNKNVAIVVSGHEDDWGAIKKKSNMSIVGELLCVDIDHQKISAPGSGDRVASVNIYIVNQSSNCIARLLDTIISISSGSEIFIAVHDSKKEDYYPLLKSVRRCVEEKSCKVHTFRFYHEPEPKDEFWEKGLEPFIQAIVGGEANSDVCAKFSELCRKARIIIEKENKIEQAQKVYSLRSEILTPFVTLHLALQDFFDENKLDEKWNVKKDAVIFDNACKECCGRIKDLDQSKGDYPKGLLREFLNLTVGEVDEGELLGDFKNLKDTVARLSEVISYDEEDRNDNKNRLQEFTNLFTGSKRGKGLIGDFADKLEAVVSKIE